MIVAAPGLLIITVAIIAARRRKRRLAAFHSEFSTAAPDAALIDVRYASDNRFRQTLKLFPWNMYGVLVVRDRGAEAHLVTSRGHHPIVLTFTPEQHTIEWRSGHLFSSNGALAWLVVTDPDGERHYFTAETGATILGTCRKTAAMVDQLESALRLRKCRQCEYLLWGNVSGVCPECGTAFQRPGSA